MSYLTHAQDPRRRVAALTGTLAVNAALGVALVVGLTFTGLAPPKIAWNPPVTLTPEPTPPPPEPAPQQETPQTVITVPPTPLDPIVRDPIEVAVRDRVDDLRLVVDPRPRVEPVADPQPRSLFTPRKAAPTNDPNRWITTEDYPGRPLRDGVEGTASYRVIVGTNGRASACDVTRSSGNIQLDAATCTFIGRRARFEAATDETGARVVGTHTGTVKWEIPD